MHKRGKRDILATAMVGTAIYKRKGAFVENNIWVYKKEETWDKIFYYYYDFFYRKTRATNSEYFFLRL